MPYHLLLNGYKTTEALRLIQPDYIIVDLLWRFSLLVNPTEKPEIGNWWVSRQQFWDVMDERRSLVLEVSDLWLTYDLQLYKMDWS